VPSTNPEVLAEKPIIGSNGRANEFVSPMYDSLEVNIPHPMMAFSDTQFREGIPLFPGHEEVRRYLNGYTADVLDYVRFGTQVTKVKLVDEWEKEEGNIQALWEVTGVYLQTGESFTEQYDAVIVANGHYSTPHIPDIPGLKGWAAQFPGSVQHSKYYRTTKLYRDKRVIVVGTSASGLDIATQLTSACKLPVYQSQRSKSEFSRGFSPNPKISTVGQITHLDPSARKITFIDGTELTDVDIILFCTGYLYTASFLPLDFPSDNARGKGMMIPGLWKHLFSATHPSLTYLALPQKILPFPVAEAQACAVARVYSGRLALPSKAEMATWEAQRWEEVGGVTRRFHTFAPGEDGRYINWLIEWARTAKGGDREGKMMREWGEREMWLREKVPEMRRAFMERGEGRREVRTLEELGFAWKGGDDGGLHKL
jgi:cation diffusion facilitator CzcD-associated flavoprotein CzcO